MQREAVERFQLWQKEDAVTSLLKAHQAYVEAIARYGGITLPQMIGTTRLSDHLSFPPQAMVGILALQGMEARNWRDHQLLLDNQMIETYSRGTNYRRFIGGNR